MLGFGAKKEGGPANKRSDGAFKFEGDSLPEGAKAIFVGGGSRTSLAVRPHEERSHRAHKDQVHRRARACPSTIIKHTSQASQSSIIVRCWSLTAASLQSETGHGAVAVCAPVGSLLSLFYLSPLVKGAKGHPSFVEESQSGFTVFNLPAAINPFELRDVPVRLSFAAVSPSAFSATCPPIRPSAISQLPSIPYAI